MNKYRKAIVAALTPVLLVVVHGIITGEWKLDELEASTVTAITALAVLGVPNERPTKH